MCSDYVCTQDSQLGPNSVCYGEALLPATCTCAQMPSRIKTRIIALLFTVEVNEQAN